MTRLLQKAVMRLRSRVGTCTTKILLGSIVKPAKSSTPQQRKRYAQQWEAYSHLHGGTKEGGIWLVPDEEEEGDGEPIEQDDPIYRA